MLAYFSLSEMRDKFQQLSMREQLLVILVIGAVVYLLIDSLVFSTQKQRQQDIENEVRVLQSQIVVLSAEMAAVERTRADELEQKEREYRGLKQQVAQLEAVTGSVSAEAPKIGQLAGDVLGVMSGKVKAVGIRTVPVRTLFGAPKPAGTAVTVQPVYMHGLDIELKGTYLDLLSYLNQLEDAHPKLFWSNAVFGAGTYPENTLRASVFMLSTQPNL